VTARPRRLAHDALETAATEVAVLVIGLATGVVTARLLGPHHRGVFSLFGVFPTTLAVLVKLGVAQANVYFLRRERVAPGAVLANSIALALVVGAATVGLVLLFRETILSTVLRGAEPIHLFLLLPLVPAVVLQSYLFAVLQGQGLFRVFNRRSLLQAVATLGGMALALGPLGLGLLGAMVVSVVVQVAMTVWVLGEILRSVPIRTVRPDGVLLGRTLRFGVKSHVQALAAHLHARVDLYMLAYFLAPTEVAFYAIATRLAELLFLVPQSLGVALYPRLAGHEPGAADALTARACRVVASVALPAAAALVLGGPWLLEFFYGSAYAGAAGPLRLLVPATCSMSLYFLLSRNFTSRNRQEVNLLAAGVALGGNVALNVFLIPRMGVTGAAMSSMVSYGLAATILVVAFLRSSRLRLRDILLPRPADFTSAIAGILGSRRAVAGEPGR
jgi:O-antigen/teichoic acid export membrane protein